MNNFTDLKSRRKIGGHKAKAYGQMFEKLFDMACKRHGIGVTQIPDSCKQISGSKIMRVKSPFDWVMSYQGHSAMIDTKTTEHDTFSRSDIVEHQVKELLVHEMGGTLGGYVIWFRAMDQIVFMPASTLNTLKRSGIGASINARHVDAILLGSSHDFQLVRLFQAK